MIGSETCRKQAVILFETESRASPIGLTRLIGLYCKMTDIPIQLLLASLIAAGSGVAATISPVSKKRKQVQSTWIKTVHTLDIEIWNIQYTAYLNWPTTSAPNFLPVHAMDTDANVTKNKNKIDDEFVGLVIS